MFMNLMQITGLTVSARGIYLLLCGLTGAIFLPSAFGQQSIGRTQDSGSWNDGNWSDVNGPSSTPGINDNAYIGFFDVGQGWVANATVDLDSDAEVSGLYLGDGANFGILNINSGATLQAANLQLSSGSTLNLDGSLGVLNLYATGGAINQNGALFADSLNLGWAGEAVTFNRTSGDIYANYLRLDHGSSLSIAGNDTLGSVMASNASVLTVESQLSLSDLSLSNSTLVLNGNLEASLSLALSNSTLVRHNNAIFSTADLYLDGVQYDLDGADFISNSVSVTSGGTLTISNPTVIPGTINSNQSTVNIDADTVTTYLSVNDSTLNLNANLEVSQILYANGGTINQNGNVIGSLNLGAAGSGTIFNRNSGTLSLSDLSIAGTDLALGNGDSVVIANAYAGSTLTINTPMQMGGVSIGESTLVLNESLALDSYVSLYQSTVIRNNGAGLTTPDLYVSTMDYQLDGTDNVSNNIYFDTGTLDVSTSTTLSGSLSVTQAIVNIDAEVLASVISAHKSTLNINAAIQADSIHINGGDIYQNGDLSGGSLSIGVSGDVANFNRVSGTMTFEQLQLSSGNQLSLTGLDTFAEINVFTDSTLTFQQSDSQLTGLDLRSLVIESGSNLNLLFDGVSGDGLDWGLRLAGDQEAFLNVLLNDGRLTSNWMDASVVYDAGVYGDYTYFGAVTAVPEPSACTLLAIVALGGMLRRRDRRS